MKISKVIVKIRTGKNKYELLHDQEITPPVTIKQIEAALRQKYTVLCCVVDGEVASVTVMEKPDEAE